MISESGETVYLKRTPQAKKDSMNRAETTKIAGYFQKANLSMHAMSCLAGLLALSSTTRQSTWKSLNL